MPPMPLLPPSLPLPLLLLPCHRSFHCLCHCAVHHRRCRHLAIAPSIAVPVLPFISVNVAPLSIDVVAIASLSCLPSQPPLSPSRCCRANHRCSCHRVAIVPSITVAAVAVLPSRHPLRLPSRDGCCHRAVHHHHFHHLAIAPPIAGAVVPSIAVTVAQSSTSLLSSCRCTFCYRCVAIVQSIAVAIGMVQAWVSHFVTPITLP
jgi:hypothetical protein